LRDGSGASLPLDNTILIINNHTHTHRDRQTEKLCTPLIILPTHRPPYAGVANECHHNQRPSLAQLFPAPSPVPRHAAAEAPDCVVSRESITSICIRRILYRHCHRPILISTTTTTTAVQLSQVLTSLCRPSYLGSKRVRWPRRYCPTSSQFEYTPLACRGWSNRQALPSGESFQHGSSGQPPQIGPGDGGRVTQ